MTALELDIAQTHDRLWRKRTVSNRIRKLGEEFGELAEALAEYIAAVNCSNGEFEARKQALKDEAGDMGIVLADFCILVGFSLDDAMRQKLAKTKAREAEAERASRRKTR